MKVYSPAEVSELLGIKHPTLRKYSIMLEERGYNIERNSQNHRYYQDKDIITLRRVISGSKSGATLEESINNVLSIDKGNTYPNAINNGNEANENDIEELKALIHKQSELLQQQSKDRQQQNELIKELVQRLDQQQEYIHKRLDQQDERLKERDRLLMQSFDEKMETQRQIAATVAAEEKKKGFFAQLFGRK